MSKTYQAAGYSEIGNGRRLNEDSIGLSDIDGGGYGIFILCDCMGGHKRGDLASELAVRYTRRFIMDRLELDLDARELRALLYAALSDANHRVYQFGERSDRFLGMGTTIVAVILRYDGLLVYGHAGDSRLYSLYRGFHRLTTDHSVAQAFIERGLLREEDLATFPRRNEITSCIGMGDEMEATLGARHMNPGERLLLCSDGLHGVCPDRVIERTMKMNDDPTETCHALIRLALDYQSRDNISCIVVDYHGSTPI